MVDLMAKNPLKATKNKPQNLSIMIRFKADSALLHTYLADSKYWLWGGFPSWLQFCVFVESALMTSPRADRLLNAFTTPLPVGRGQAIKVHQACHAIRTAG